MTTQLQPRPAVETQSTTDSQTQTMKAVVFRKFGPPEQLVLADIAKPAVDDDGVVVRVRAACISRRRSERTSPRCAARGTWTWSERSAPTASSTTPRKISPAADSATT